MQAVTAVEGIEEYRLANGLQLLLVNYSVDFSQLDVVQVMKWVPPK